MHVQTRTRWYAAIALGAMVTTGVAAQTVTLKPRGAAGTVTARRAGTSTVSVTGQGKDALVTIKSTNGDARTLFRDLATKSGAKILLGTSAGGFVTSTVEGKPIEMAIRTVATAGGLTVRKVLVSSSTATALTEDTISPLAGALVASITDAVVVDPATGKSVTLTYSDTAPKADTAKTTVYFVMRPARTGAATVTGDAAKDAIANAASCLSGLSATEKMQAVRDLQRQMFEGMTDEERQQMFQGGGRGFGGPGQGGFGQNGGPGGPPPGGFGENGGPGGPPPGGFGENGGPGGPPMG